MLFVKDHLKISSGECNTIFNLTFETSTTRFLLKLNVLQIIFFIINIDYLYFLNKIKKKKL